MRIRDVTAADVSAMTALANAKRTEYATYSPVFGHKSDNNMEAQTGSFTDRMLPSDTIISLVADTDGVIEGFVIGQLRAAPPVYDPGSAVCWIDDFTVAHPALWETVGTALYRAATMRAQQRGSVAMVTIVGHLDTPKRDAASTGCTDYGRNVCAAAPAAAGRLAEALAVVKSGEEDALC